MKTSASGRPRALGGRARTLALCVLLLAFFMDLLDTTIVNVALPALQQGLAASDGAVQWIVAGYTLAFALLLITGGRMGDIFGYKRMFMLGMAGFTLASTLCGLADDAVTLIVARILQGALAALMVPQIMSLIQVMYTSHHERSGISAYYGGIAGLATVSGPILGALLIGQDAFGLGWRAIFLINLPVGVLALILAHRHLPDARSARAARLDLRGVVLSVVAIALLVVPLMEREIGGQPALAAAWVLTGLAVATVFTRTQVRMARLGESPLVVPSLFRARSYSAGALVLLGFHAVVAGFLMTLTIMLQTGLGLDVLDAGLTGIPFSLGVSVAAALTGPVWVPRFGRKVTTVGPLVMALGMAALVLSLRRGMHAPLLLTPVLCLSGVGMGLLVASIMPFVLAGVPKDAAGSASGVLNMASQLGSALGVAGFGAIFFAHLQRGNQGVVIEAFSRSIAWQIVLLVAVAGLSLALPSRLHGGVPEGSP